MGMSASQVRLLTITKRIHSVENEAERVQNQKMLLGLQSDEAYEEYLAAMEMKNIEYAWFNGDTGNFEWDKLTIQSLFDNGYNLKVKQVATQYPQAQTVLGQSTIANTASTYSTYSALSGLSGTNSIYVPTSSNLTQIYNSTSTGGQVSFSGTLESVYNNPLQTQGLLSSNIVQNLGPANQVTDFTDNYSSITDFYVDKSNIQAFLESIYSGSRDYEQKHVYLIGDIDIAADNISWTPGSSPIFKGTFNGNGYTISNLDQALFKTLSDGACVENLIIDKAQITSGGAVGAIAKEIGFNNGTVDIVNCAIKNSNIESDTTSAGGFVGQVSSNNVNISKCYVDQATYINAPNSAAGGFIGYALNNNGTVTITDSYSVASATGSTAQGGFVGYQGETLNVSDSYTTGSYIGDGIGTVTHTNNSLETINTTHALTVNYSKPGTPNASVSVYVDSNDNITSIVNKIQTALDSAEQGIFQVSNNNNQLSITSTANNGFYEVNSVVDNDPNLINLANRLGFANPLQPVSNQSSTAPHAFDGTLSFEINGTTIQNSIQLSGCNNLTDILNKIKTAIDTELGELTSKVTLDNSGKISIFIPDTNGNHNTIGNFFANITQNWEYPAGNPTLVQILGLDNLGTPTDDSYVIPGTPQNPDGEFHICHSIPEVLQHLGSGVDINSASVLRELIYNAYAIIMAPIYDEDLGHSIMQETSVATNVGLREKTDNTQLAQAEANYEAALRRIDKKEEQYDKDLAKFDQERKALTSELDTLKTCIKENIDRTFKIFQG